MTRIIGGSAGGRRLRTPAGEHTRPTSERVREALFSAIEAWCGSLAGLRFLDLYAGSGAVGLEAWSRGAAAVTLVERDRRTANLISDNAASLGCEAARVVTGAVGSVLLRGPDAPHDLAYLDPPYPTADSAVADDLEALDEHGWLVPGALVVVERSVRGAPLTWPPGYAPRRERRYGETMLWHGLWYGHASPGPAPEE